MTTNQDNLHDSLSHLQRLSTSKKAFLDIAENMPNRNNCIAGYTTRQEVKDVK